MITRKISYQVGERANGVPREEVKGITDFADDYKEDPGEGFQGLERGGRGKSKSFSHSFCYLPSPQAQIYLDLF